LVYAARDARAPAEDALAAAGTLLLYVDVATEEAGGACLEAQQLLVADSDRVRRDLLDDLLAGRRPRPPRAAARLPHARLHVGRAAGTCSCSTSPRASRVIRDFLDAP